MKEWLIAHRGAQKDALENTVEAFKAATKLPVSYIELDIHTTKDGVVICNHDFIINGLTIDECTYKQLKKAKPDLATFDEAIEAVGGMRPFIVEIKPTGTAKHAINLLKKNNDWLVTSFKLEVMNELIELGFDKKRLVLLQHKNTVWQIRRAKNLGVGAISVNQRNMTPRIYRRAVFSGLDIYTYVVNSKRQAKIFRFLYPKLKIYTDRPDLLEELK